MPTQAVAGTTTITLALEWDQFKNLKPKAYQYPVHVFCIIYISLLMSPLIFQLKI